MLDAVHLQTVRLERAALGERLLAQVALVRPDAGVGAGVPLQVERVVEALGAERAQVALHVRVALHVPVQQPLQAERFRADAADEPLLVVVRVGAASVRAVAGGRAAGRTAAVGRGRRRGGGHGGRGRGVGGTVLEVVLQMGLL